MGVLALRPGYEDQLDGLVDDPKQMGRPRRELGGLARFDDQVGVS
jgi:hypothetical protein